MSRMNNEILNNYRDYYALLGVERDASEREIRLAFLSLVRKYHPDKNTSKFRVEGNCCSVVKDENGVGNKKCEIIVKYHALYEAYSTLKDPIKRNEYNASLFNKGISKNHSWHKVFNLNELVYYEDEEVFCYFCNCGEVIVLEKKHIEEGYNLFPCDSCSTKITITL
ncbi:domain zf-CSL following [Cryptosporidium xiaoi]|uniref:Domain zf-CSL following n=1 Tax=Cryptosporidium xiaoi TaxID=659607 RepID=A0AAV9XYS9_9CRYT